MKISSEVDKKKVKNMLGEISNSYTRIAAERDLIKETIKEMSDQFDIPKPILRKMAKVYHKQNFHTEQADHEEFEQLYTEVVETK